MDYIAAGVVLLLWVADRAYLAWRFERERKDLYDRIMAGSLMKYRMETGGPPPPGGGYLRKALEKRKKMLGRLQNGGE